MRNHRLQKVFSLFLSVAVLTWGTVLPSLRHAHAGGSDSIHLHNDAPERPAVDHDHEHSQGNGYQHDHLHHCPVVPVELPPDATRVDHMHWSWLGLDFSTPLSSDPADEDKDSKTDPMVLVRGMAKVEGLSVSEPMHQEVLLLSTAFGIASDDSVPSTSIHASVALTSIPLCDSARRERTGVLLA